MISRRRILIGLSFVLALAAIIWTYNWFQLTSLRHKIETRYASQIAGLEAGSHDLPSLETLATNDVDAWQAAHDKGEAIRKRIADSWSGSEVAVVGWSFDGHHQPESLVWNVDKGYSRSALWWSSDTSGQRTVRFGETFDGRSLVILTARIADGQKHEYEIGILASAAKTW